MCPYACAYTQVCDISDKPDTIRHCARTHDNEAEARSPLQRAIGMLEIGTCKHVGYRCL